MSRPKTPKASTRATTPEQPATMPLPTRITEARRRELAGRIVDLADDQSRLHTAIEQARGTLRKVQGELERLSAIRVSGIEVVEVPIRYEVINETMVTLRTDSPDAWPEEQTSTTVAVRPATPEELQAARQPELPFAAQEGGQERVGAPREVAQGETDRFLDPATPEAGVDAELRRMGMDPAEIAARGAKFVEAAMGAMDAVVRDVGEAAARVATAFGAVGTEKASKAEDAGSGPEAPLCAAIRPEQPCYMCTLGVGHRGPHIAGARNTRDEWYEAARWPVEGESEKASRGEEQGKAPGDEPSSLDAPLAPYFCGDASCPRYREHTDLIRCPACNSFTNLREPTPAELRAIEAAPEEPAPADPQAELDRLAEEQTRDAAKTSVRAKRMGRQAKSAKKAARKGGGR